MSEGAPTIAVVIPAYNSAPYLAETLAAITGQSRPPDEIIVVDDGSTDNTAQIARDFGAPVRCISIDNGGQGRARAIGIEKAASDWIALCDSDDLWRPDHLQRRLQLLQRYPSAQMTFSDFYSFGPNADPEHYLLSEAPDGWLERWAVRDDAGFYRLKQSYPAILAFNPAYLSGVMFRRDSYHAMGGFNNEFSRWIGEDSEFMRRFSALEQVVFVGDTRQTWGYRRHANNYSLIQWRNINAKADILDALLARGTVPKRYVRITESERDLVRCRAFDQACWEKAHCEIDALYRKLPPTARSGKRSLKRYLAKLRVSL